ncbi:MAG: hypothetical protein FGM37_09280 [Phycisphaerales bacterium]|nr:hypothetical protein [Phycisphaerales bacterium]
MSDGAADIRALASQLLDGTISVQGAAELSAAIERDPEAARELARLAMLHDALDRQYLDVAAGRAHARRWAVMHALRRVSAVAAAVAVATLAIWASVRSVPSADASDVLARIVATARGGDRTYVLRVDSAAKPAGKRRDEALPSFDPRARDGRRRQAPIDGAVLTVRDPNRYVLVRTDDRGRQVVSGCDGATAWIVPADGPVRVSGDTRRFSGALPGSQHDLPFINPHESLPDLAASYSVVIHPAEPAAGQPWPRISATRRADAKGGPRTVEIEYDPESGMIRTMRLGQLPQARGGPRAVTFELVDTFAVADGHFSHRAHHDDGRAVLEE